MTKELADQLPIGKFGEEYLVRCGSEDNAKEVLRLVQLGLRAEIVLKQKEYYLANPNKIDGIFYDLGDKE